LTACLLAIGVLVLSASQDQPKPVPLSAPVPLNWLYGAYVPKDAPLVPLSGAERRRLWSRQIVLTPGIYFKSGLFALADQMKDAPREWHGGVVGYGQRFGSRYGQFAIQTSFATAANAALGYEPRYDLCRCSGVWPRARHALVRNFVTYDRSERGRRPQIGLYAGAWAAGLATATWKPGNTALKEGGTSLLTQAIFGSLSNVIAEFAAEIRSRAIRRQ
jgi:hypothetical protein